MEIKEKIARIETSLRWHKRLILALYALIGLLLISLFSKVTFTGLSFINLKEVKTMDWIILQPLLVVLAALLRSILGWAKASFKDGVLQDYELKKLGETIVRVGLIGAIIAFCPGVNITWIETAAVALGGDVLLNLFRKKAPEGA